MNPVDGRLSMVRRLAWLCVATVLAVTTLSAFIRVTNAGLGCAEWPRCYGERGLRPAAGAAAAADETTATIAARVAHRVMAVTALFLVVFVIAICFAERPRLRAAGATAIALLALTLFLAVLGRWSSGSRIPAISIANLVGGFAMLALSVRLAIGAQTPLTPRLRVAAFVASMVLVAQVAIGGLVSTSHAGLSCVGWSDCVAAARELPWSTLDPRREPTLTAQAPFNAAGALSQSIHRSLALLLALLLLPLAIGVFRQGRRRTAAVLAALLAAQLVAGLALAQGSLPLGLALLHNVLAACLLATIVLLL
jgi:cytochrome c oxidase assembly protein subunit 15